MSDRETQGPVVRRPTRGASLIAWLAGQPRGRWATARGRWIRTAVTAGLVLTGLCAWALAIVQPWTPCGDDLGIVAEGAALDPQKIRSLSAEVASLCDEHQPAPPKPLRRNPFAAAPSGEPAPSAAPREEGAAPSAAKAVPLEAANPAAAAAPTAKQVLDTVKGLRLEITLITPQGERWAVINGENYREGNVVAGLEIVEIQEGKVRLQQAGVTCLLRMD